MGWAAFEASNVPLIVSGLFYAALSVFSMVCGVLYITGRRELNPIELSDSFMQRLSEPSARRAFAKKMGYVTFVVGIVQAITAYAVLRANSPVSYGIALGFTAFSIWSVVIKLKAKRSTFAFAKLVAYAAILVVLLMESSRTLFV